MGPRSKSKVPVVPAMPEKPTPKVRPAPSLMCMALLESPSGEDMTCCVLASGHAGDHRWAK